MADADRIAYFEVSTPLGRLSKTGHTVGSPGVTEPGLRRLGSYALVLVCSGAGWYRDPRIARRPLGPGDCILVLPDHPHRYRSAGAATWTTYYLVFEGPVFDVWRAGGLLDPADPVVHLAPVRSWLDRFQAVTRQRSDGRRPTPLQQVCRVQALLADIRSSQRRPDLSERDGRWLERVERAIDAPPEDGFDERRLAAELGIAHETLRKRYRRLTGTTLQRRRAERVMEEACRLLTHTELRLRDIAERLGFADEFSFSKRFKAITGRAPGRYRRELD